MGQALKGTMLTPGVSKNGRLYTPELIRKAYTRLSERIAAGECPVTMLTHHAAGDDSKEIVGQVTSVALNGQNLDYTAVLADTRPAETIGALVTAKTPFLRNVSIRGAWLGEVRKENGAETADDLEIDGLDFTKNPGVTGAVVEPAGAAAKETVDGRVLITETVEAHAVFTEDAPIVEAGKEPYGNVTYADPGYQKDKKKRYPIDTKAHAKSAWSYINQKDNADLYTATQLKRVRLRIKSALKKFGVSVTTESLASIAETAPEVHMLEVAETTLSECYSCVQDGTGTAGFSISAYNGPLTVSVSAYNGVEPADLSSVAMAAMAAACDAIHALDPDDDGDIDTGATEGTQPSDQTESAPADSSTVKEAVVAATETAPEATTETAPEGTTETSTETAESAPEFVTAEQLAEAVQAAVTAALEAAKTPAAETGETTEGSTATETAPTESAPVDEAALRAKIEAEVIEAARKNGTLTRKGLVEKMGEPAKPLHEMNEDEFRAYQQDRSALFFGHNE